MKVIWFYDENDEELTPPHLFKDIDAMIKWFRDRRGIEFPQDEEDRTVIERLKEGRGYTGAVFIIEWVEVHE